MKKIMVFIILSVMGFSFFSVNIANSNEIENGKKAKINSINSYEEWRDKYLQMNKKTATNCDMFDLVILTVAAIVGIGMIDFYDDHMISEKYIPAYYAGLSIGTGLSAVFYFNVFKSLKTKGNLRKMARDRNWYVRAKGEDVIKTAPVIIQKSVPVYQYR